MSIENPDRDPGPFTDARTVLIVLLAILLSVGAGISVGFPVAAAASDATIGVVAGVSSGGAAMILMIGVLHRLIEKDDR